MEDTIKQSLKVAGKTLLDYFGKINKIVIKENQSNIVTKADIESEKAIVKIIQSKFPDHNIIAEETGFLDKGSEYTWVVDPLDGTSNFAAGIPWFGVLIAVLKNSKPIMAGIFLPLYKDLYFAKKGKGAYKNNNKIKVSDEKNLKNVLFAYSLDYSEDLSKTEKESQIIKLLVNQVRNLRSTNAVVEWAYTADGRLGGSINQTTKIWDVAATSLIIKEAGGIVTDFNGEELNFKVGKEDYKKSFSFLASNKHLHPKLMKIISKVFNE